MRRMAFALAALFSLAATILVIVIVRAGLLEVEPALAALAGALVFSVLAIVLTLGASRIVQIVPAAVAQTLVVAALFVYLGIYGKLEHRDRG